MNDVILEIKGLHKKYKDITALESLDLKVERGQVFGLLGPNGSGKTTTLAILLGALNATKGTFSWFGNGEKDENRLRIGALLETPNFYPYLNAIDNLQVVGKIKQMTNIDERIEIVLKRVNLWERRTSKFRTFSLGMKQRLAIASAMLSDPEVLVLDEPTNGLDPQGIAEIRNLVISIAAEGKTILIASHILDEVEKICTHVAILRKGQLLQAGTLDEIMTQDRMYLIKSVDLKALESAIGSIAQLKLIRSVESELLVSAGDTLNPADLNRLIAEKGIYLSGLREHRKNLETTFLEIIES